MNMARIYGVNLRPNFAELWGNATDFERDQATHMLKFHMDKSKKFTGLPFSPEEFSDFTDFKEQCLAAEIVKIKWRAAHPATTLFWRDVINSAKQALVRPNEPIPAGRVKYVYDTTGHMPFLRCILPSGRSLYYAKPYLEKVETEDWKGNKTTNYALGYHVPSKKAVQWEKTVTYAGHLVENICQAIARDILVAAMFNVEEAGYPVVMTVHDELVSETKEDFGSVEHYENLLTQGPAWSEGLPLASEGWKDFRFHK
jgi:DNA polymerase